LHFILSDTGLVPYSNMVTWGPLVELAWNDHQWCADHKC